MIFLVILRGLFEWGSSSVYIFYMTKFILLLLCHSTNSSFSSEQDIRRSISGNLLPLTSIPASSVYSVRSGGSTKSKTNSVLDSPLATSSNASSEPSVNNNSFFADGIEMEVTDFGSERGNCSPTSQPGK